MNRRFALTCMIALMLCLLSASSGVQAAAAQQTSGVTVTITAGFEQHIKTGTWFPVKVLLENNGPRLTGEIVLWFEDGGPTNSQFTYPVDLPSISRKEITLLVYASTWNSSLVWRLQDADGKSILLRKETLYLHSEGDVLYGVAAANPTPFNQLSLIDPPAGSASIAMLDVEDIPNNSRGLESLSILVLCGVDTGGLMPDQARALAEWVQYGGSLMVCGGPDWQKTLAGLLANEPTSAILPVSQITTVSVETEGADLDAILNLVPAGTPPLSASGSDLTVLAPGSASPDSTILAADAQGRPLAVVRRIGNGTVIYLSADPSIPPFSTWTGLEQLFRTLLHNSQQQPDWNAGISGWWNAVSAAQTFSGLGMPPVLLICGFLLIYMLILGPANYLLLRLLKRRELGWITTPVLVVAITLAVFVAGSLTRTGKPILNRMSLVQVWPSKAGNPQGKVLARVDGIVGIYSPSRATYQVDLAKPFVAHAPTSDGSTSQVMNFTQDGENFSVKDVRIDVSGISTIGVEGSLEMNNFPYALTANLEAGNTTLSGWFTNASPYILEDAVIISSSQSWALGDIQPGQKVELNLNLSSGASSALNPNLTQPLKPAIVPGPTTYGYSNPLDAILGTSDYWQDRETYRRYNFLSSFLFSANYGYGYMQVNGVYLAAWSKDQVIPASVKGRQSDSEDTTLFMIALPPEIAESDSALVLDPSMFSWTSPESSNTPGMPYAMYLYNQGYYVLEFSPIYDIAYSKVQSLVFTLEGMNAATVPDLEFVTFSLYDYAAGDYEPLENIAWGKNEILDPGRFVSAEGVIRLKIDSDLGYLELGRTDFTLVVER